MGDFDRLAHEKDRAEITAMVVDDDRDTVDVLSYLLQIKGISVVGVGYNGSEAVKIYKERRPDVVFLDVLMERRDGFYTLEKIREIQHDAIVILITADVIPQTRERLEKLYASAIIYKPYDINEVMDTTNKLVVKLKQKLSGEINYKKAVLKKLNQILENRQHESDTSKLRLLQYLHDREKLV
ncbi:MAG: response regulator [Thaumarchaeota archaeon]|nr:response regulator [Nitrososphaerota archaeon]